MGVPWSRCPDRLWRGLLTYQGRPAEPPRAHIWQALGGGSARRRFCGFAHPGGGSLARGPRRGGSAGFNMYTHIHICMHMSHAHVHVHAHAHATCTCMHISYIKRPSAACGGTVPSRRPWPLQHTLFRVTYTHLLARRLQHTLVRGLHYTQQPCGPTAQTAPRACASNSTGSCAPS